MKRERSVVGKLKDEVLLQVEATHFQDPVGSQSLDFVVHREVHLLKQKYRHNKTQKLSVTEINQSAVQ
jgi:hypothetical protein